MRKQYSPDEAAEAKIKIDLLVAKGMPRRVAGAMKGHITRNTVGHESAFAKIERQHRDQMEKRLKAQRLQLMGLKIERLRLEGERSALLLRAFENGASITELAERLGMDGEEVRRIIASALEARG